MDRIKAISTFVQIAKSQSLTKAAAELGISRALASAHLKQLEQHLGLRLFNRTTRRLSLTDPGAEYFSFCNELLEKFEAEEDRLTQSQGEPRGHLKIMGSMALGNAKMAPIITDFSKVYPKVRVSLLLSDRSFSPSDFVEGGYDLGISMQRLRESSVITTKVADIPWLLCASPQYLDARPPITHPMDLVQHNCLVHRSQAPNALWRFNGPDGQSEVAVKGSLFTNSAIVLHAAVISGFGISMLPLYAVGDDLKNGRLVHVLKAYSSPSRQIFIVYPDARYLPNRSRLFIDFVRRRMKSTGMY